MPFLMDTGLAPDVTACQQRSEFNTGEGYTQDAHRHNFQFARNRLQEAGSHLKSIMNHLTSKNRRRGGTITSCIVCSSSHLVDKLLWS